MDSYYIYDGIQTEGPLTFDNLSAKNIKKYTLIWKTGLTEWMTADKFQELQALIAAAPPAPPSKPTPPAPPSAEEKKSASDGFFEVYSEATKTIRVWFVTFGIGGLYLLITTGELLKKLQAEHQLHAISLLFLTGIGVQLFIAIVNKWINWINYNSGETNVAWYEQFSDWLSRQFWIDIIVDIVTAYCYGKIIWLMINIYSK